LSPLCGVPVDLLQDRRHATHAVDVFEVHLGAAGRDFADIGCGRRDFVQPVQIERDARRVRQGQRMQDCVGRAAHGHIDHKGVDQSLLGDDIERPDILLQTPLQSVRGPFRKLDPVGIQLGGARRLVRPALGRNGSIAGQRQADHLTQAVHGVRGEHARAASATRAGALGQRTQLGIAHLARAVLANAFEHGDQVRVALARQHRPAAQVNGGDVDAHHGVVHGGNDLVAVGDPNPGIARVRANDRLDFVRNQLA
jgi:hypothetical protein